jgi:hypothetical protein
LHYHPAEITHTRRFLAVSISEATKEVCSRPNSLRLNFGYTFNSAAIGPIPSAEVPTNRSLLYSLILARPLCSNSVIAGYQSAFGTADTALRLIFVHSAPNPRPHPPYTATSPVQLGVTTSSAPEAPYRYPELVLLAEVDTDGPNQIFVIRDRLSRRWVHPWNIWYRGGTEAIPVERSACICTRRWQRQLRQV